MHAAHMPLTFIMQVFTPYLLQAMIYKRGDLMTHRKVHDLRGRFQRLAQAGHIRPGHNAFAPRRNTSAALCAAGLVHGAVEGPPRRVTPAGPGLLGCLRHCAQHFLLSNIIF